MGTPRDGLRDFGWAFSRPFFSLGFDFGAFGRAAPAGAFVPKTSDRMTETADSTKSHSTARKPSLIRVSVSSDIQEPSLRRGGCRLG